MAAYTVERYELARRLFPKTPKEDLCKEEIRALAGPYYQLRERKDRGTILTWVDDEEDGDYDPEEEVLPKKRKSPPRPSRMAPVAKRARSRSPTPILTPLPDPESDSASETDPWDTYWALGAESEDTSTPYKLRTRKKLRDAENGEATGTTEDESTESHSDDEPFTSEGCLACQELELPCSSVEDPSFYPCQTCRDDGLECELCPAPKRKRACERCRHERDGGPCSYLSPDYDHSLPCRACLEHGFQCLAGPAKPKSEAGMSTGTDTDTDTDTDTSTDEDTNTDTDTNEDPNTDTETDAELELARQSSREQSEDPSVAESTGYPSSSDSEYSD